MLRKRILAAALASAAAVAVTAGTAAADVHAKQLVFRDESRGHIFVLDFGYKGIVYGGDIFADRRIWLDSLGPQGVQRGPLGLRSASAETNWVKRGSGQKYRVCAQYPGSDKVDCGGFHKP